MAGKIFINYRRGDDAGYSGRLFDRLQEAFPPQQLFMDVDNIEPGLDFVRVLNDRVAECDVVLAVIGRGWLDARDASGRRRLDDPDDFVRIEIASALDQGKRVVPVLVNDAAMPRPDELPEVLRPLSRRNAVRLTHERFHSDAQGLIKALQQSLDEMEAQRRAADEERKRKAEREAHERAAAERRREEAIAKQRAEEERAFAAAKRVGTVLALDAFLVAHPDGSLAAEAQRLKAVLLAREEAYQRTKTSTDPAVLRSFITTYRSGADVDQVRRQLEHLGWRRGWQPRVSIILAGVLGTMAIAAAAATYWLQPRLLRLPEKMTQTMRAPAPAATPSEASSAAVLPERRPDQRAWDLLKQSTDEAALKRFTIQYPDSPLGKDVEARIAALESAKAAEPAAPSPDEAAWLLVKDQNDEAALKQFIAQYPLSPLRKAAEARLAALVATAAAKSVSLPPDQIAWSLVKDSTDPDQLRHFVEQFPDSSKRADIETRIAALEATAAQAAADAASRSQEQTRALQLELKRVGCFRGEANGQFDAATKASWREFLKLTSLNLPDEASADALKAIRGVPNRVCPLQCAAGQHSDGDQCVANAPPATKRAKAEPANTPAHALKHPAARASGSRCFSFQGQRFCE